MINSSGPLNMPPESVASGLPPGGSSGEIIQNINGQAQWSKSLYIESNPGISSTYYLTIANRQTLPQAVPQGPNNQSDFLPPDILQTHFRLFYWPSDNSLHCEKFVGGLSGNAETATTVMPVDGIQPGQLYYYGEDNQTHALPSGLPGQILVSQGPNLPPIWQDR